MYTKIIFIFFLSFFSYSLSSLCDHLPPEGIGPLFSFGHTILPKYEFGVGQEVFYLKQKPHSGTFTGTLAYYGITDNFTGILTIPIYSQTSTEFPGPKTGLADIFLNFDYMLYKNETKNYRYRIIGMAGIRFPTSTVAARTFFSFNRTNFFLGIVHDAMSIDGWYVYSDFGSILTNKKNHIKFGNLLLFNIGVGHIFCFKDDYFVIFFIEMSNFYSWPDILNNIPDLTTGSNLLLIGPTLRLENKSFLIQGGIQCTASRFTRIETADNIKYFAGCLIAYIF